MQFGALGDIHGDFEPARRIMEHHPDVPFWVCVGDLADEHGRYAPVPQPLFWIKGNNEDFDAIAEAAHKGLPCTVGAEHLYYIPNGRLIEVPVGQPFTGRRTTDSPTTACLRVAGLGGTFAPTWYETPAADLPHPKKGSARATEQADKRRHFVREEVAACAAMRGVDLFLTHEAPRPYRIGRLDAGKTPVNEVLAAMKPRLHLFGHHHRFSEQERQGVRSVGLDVVSRSYLLIDADTMEYHVELP
jgi:Calcineurin-like phosphoesterase